MNDSSARVTILFVLVVAAWTMIYHRSCRHLEDPAAERERALLLGTEDTVARGPEDEADPDDVRSPAPADGEAPRPERDAADPPGGDADAAGTADPIPPTDVGTDGSDGTAGSERDVAAPPADGPPERTRYTVVAGDTMESIAQSWFGSRGKWVLIAQENPLVDPTKLRVGATLRLPPRGTDIESVPADVLEQLTRGTVYEVSPNDTLSGIARQFYGDPTKWRVILEANRDVIRRPEDLRPGDEIVIPPYQRPAD